MKNKTFKFVLPVLLPAVMLTLVSCSSTPEPSGEGDSVTAYRAGVPGGVAVETFEITASVTAVNHAQRTATLVTPEGKQTEFKAGPGVINFDQVRVGDQVKAIITEQLVVYVREKSEAPSQEQAGLVALAPRGAKPGAVMAETVEITTRVKSVDLKNQKATLDFPDGSTRTVAVRPDVRLSTADIGREVVIQATQAVAIRVEKP
jgi:hypothetical protein